MQRRAEGLASGSAAERPRLGIAIAPPRAARRMRAAVGLPERDGLLVRGVVADSPAAKAGVERGDLLVGVNGTPLSSVDALFDALDAGGELKVTVVRGTEERDVEISLQ
jgi:serine protease Do